MKQGYFSDFAQVPMINCLVRTRFGGDIALNVRFVIDTGAHNVVMGPLDSRTFERQFGISVRDLPPDPDGIRGVTGRADAWLLEGDIHLGEREYPVVMKVMEPFNGSNQPGYSLLGRPVLSQVTLVMDARNSFIALYD